MSKGHELPQPSTNDPGQPDCTLGSAGDRTEFRLAGCWRRCTANEDSGVSRNILNRKTFSANNMENGMAVGPRRQVDGEVISLSCRATVRAVYAGAIALMLVSSQAAAADMPERYHGAVERDPTLIGRTSDGESWPVTQRRLHAQKSPRKEPYGSGSQRNAAKARLLATTGVLVAPRVPEKKSRPPAADIEDEQLFREFLEWQKRPKETP